MTDPALRIIHQDARGDVILTFQIYIKNHGPQQ